MTAPARSADEASRLQWAQFFVEIGNLAAADLLSRRVLADGPHPTAYAILAAVAEAIGDGERALEYGEIALNGGESSVADSLARLRSDLSQRKSMPSGSAGFLLVKSWGQGFWSDVAHAAGGLLLSEVTGRTPVIWWGSRSRYGDGSDRNAFENFFEPVNACTIEDLRREEVATFFPASWNRANLPFERDAAREPIGSRFAAICFFNRPERIAVADCFLSIPDLAPWIPRGHALSHLSIDQLWRYILDKHLRPTRQVSEAVDRFVADKFGGQAFVAAHIRGSDKGFEWGGVREATRAVFARLDRIGQDCPIFLMTDDERIARGAVERYGARIVMTDCQRSNSERGIHYLDGTDRVRAGREVMIDVYVALRAERFVGMGQSNLSAVVPLLKQWEPARCELIDGSILLKASGYLYLPEQLVPLCV